MNLSKNIPFYYPTHKEVEIAEAAYLNKLPILLKGPTGSGKSRFVEFLAAKLNTDLITVSCHEETSSVDLIGRYILKGSETMWIDGPLLNAMKSGAIIYLDEIAEARPDVIVAIHPLTDYRRELYIDKLASKVIAHTNFQLIASYNPGYQRGFKELKPSTRQRFVSINFDFPTPPVETEILVKETQIDTEVAKKLVFIGNKIRNLKELGLTETASTRLLIDAAKLINSGLSSRLAVRSGIVEPLTDDRDAVEAICDMSNLIL